MAKSCDVGDGVTYVHEVTRTVFVLPGQLTLLSPWPFQVESCEFHVFILLIIT